MEPTNLYIVWAYGFYVLISVMLTVWVTRTLSKNGLVFLVEAFNNNRELASSVNHLLVVGFYLINVGYVTLALRYGDKPTNLQESIEFLSTKVGLVLLVLGAMDFFNLSIFTRMRKRATRLHQPVPPVIAQSVAGTAPARG